MTGSVTSFEVDARWRPIENLLTVVQKVTKEKSYSMRAPAAEIEELHMLGRAINNMLDRIEQQFNKVQQAEQEKDWK